ncbi:MAG: peptidoglycan-binding protein [Proteobacteria bacterium]|nr:peptidoglycan-binding protein [Pseudomonadota bacterium]
MDEVRSPRLGVKVSPADRFSSSIRREESGAKAEARRLMVSFGVVAGVLAIAIGATLYIWHDVGAPADMAGAPSASAQVQEIEVLLNELGFTPGPQDGVMDEATAEAIRAYQQAAGLPEDGIASPALLEELKAVAGESD